MKGCYNCKFECYPNTKPTCEDCFDGSNWKPKTMITLKQIFREQRKQHYHKYGDTIPYNPINGVKEWLQQELDTMQKGEYGEKTMIIKLLEKLEQWKKPYAKTASTATENTNS